MSSSWNWPGSHWWRVDLHTHSPVSYDFGSQADRDALDWVRWIEAVRDAGIDAVAITDHNVANAVKPLKDVVSNVVDAPVLFPGVELTANDGTHLLLLMDPARKQQHVEDLLSRAEIPVDRRGQQDARSPLSVEQILKVCGDDVLIIGAHVNRPNGLLQHGGQQRLAELREPRLASVEVDPSQDLDESWLDGKRPEIGRRLAQVWSSDGHGFDQLGQRFTWVKMTNPSLEGLRLALLDGDDSLKPALRNSPGAPNTHAALALESITVSNAKFIGRQNPITVEFNPWLNAIIGGRGTGKSTLVDLCRKALRREAELDNSAGEEGSLRSLFDRRMRVPASQREEGLLTKTTGVKVVYRKDGERFVLSWDQDGKATPIMHLTGDMETPEEGDIHERFPVRIYSQKQLFELAKDPNALFTVIDDSQTVRGPELKRLLDQTKALYLSLQAEARAVFERVSDLPARKMLLADVRHKIKILQEGGHASVLNKYRLRRQQDGVWQAILEASLQVVELMERRAEELAVSDLDLGADDSEDLASESLRRAHGALQRTVEDLRGVVHKAIGQARRDIEQIREGEDLQKWHKAVVDSENEFKSTSFQLSEEGISDPNQYRELIERAATIEREIQDLEKERERAKRLESEASTILAEYRKIRSELNYKRQQFATETSSEVIRIEIDTYANTEALVEDLREILGTERFDEDRQSLVQKIRPKQNQSWSWEKLDKVVAGLRRFLVSGQYPWSTRDRRFETLLQKIPPERLDRLVLFLPEDAVRVSFRDHQGGTWKSLAQGSPGQQTAALLTFVLGYGSEPIILDQPEDDLDNTLIYELLVSQLRETKINRQLIVVTHNPNIVVHGDAELVISLETAKGQTLIKHKGGLQEKKVRAEICRVMEGGREAFESRYRRIMPAERIGV